MYVVSNNERYAKVGLLHGPGGRTDAVLLTSKNHDVALDDYRGVNSLGQFEGQTVDRQRLVVELQKLLRRHHRSSMLLQQFIHAKCVPT
ncbi:MAG: hypothetical protein C0483_23295 [Pirellula sp.]|nr:hypothetical protein [Pirellula sp.]